MDEWDILAAEMDSALGMFSGLQLSASAVMLVLLAFGLWRLMLRRRRRAAALAARRAAERAAAAHAAADLAAHPTAPSPERTTMLPPSITARALPVRALPARAAAGLSRGRAAGSHALRRSLDGLRIRWDRTALFVLALLALLVFLVSGVAAALGSATAAVAGWSLLVAVGALVALRSLTVRDRTRRAAPASQAAESPAPVAEETAHVPAADPARDQQTFAAVRSFGADAAEPSATVPAPTSADAGRASGAGSVTVTGTGAGPASAADSATSAGVVIPAVPRPTYLDAPEVARPMPEPLTLEPAPSSSTRLRDAARQGQDAAQDHVFAAGPAVLEGAGAPDAGERADGTAVAEDRDVVALDLDSVLARRRAS